MHTLLQAVHAAVKAGEAILKVYSDADLGVEIKADNSPLTRADRAANAVIVQALQATDLPILSEEGRDIPFMERAAWTRFWLVDPLDGTKEFIKRNGEFTVNIALVENGAPVAGVVYAPVPDVLYFGISGQGAFKTEGASKIEMSSPDVLIAHSLPLPRSEHADDVFVIVGSRSHPSPEFADYVEAQRMQHPRIDIRSIGSSLKICLVAEGAADVYPRLGPTMEWDTAAGHAVALAAGCRVHVFATDTPLLYNKENLLNPFFIISRK